MVTGPSTSTVKAMARGKVQGRVHIPADTPFQLAVRMVAAAAELFTIVASLMAANRATIWELMEIHLHQQIPEVVAVHP